MMNEEIAIRSIQHYLYCPHRWGLMEIGSVWQENYFVTKGNLLHKNVHHPDKLFVGKNKKAFTSVSVFNDQEEYNLYGIVDRLECMENSAGVMLDDGKRYGINIVEYKPTSPKKGEYREEDLMQVFAQKICVDYTLGCNSKGYIYYGNDKKRVELPFEKNFSHYDKVLKQVLNEIRENIKNGYIPAIKRGQRCSGCSMKALCMPSVSKRISEYHKTLFKVNSEDVM